MAVAKNKRPIATIDLTGDDDENTNPRANKLKKHSLPTPPTSSQALRSSQPLPSGSFRSSQNVEASSSHSNERDRWLLPPRYDDSSSELNLSQGFDDSFYESCGIYGILNTKIVGIQYYKGEATKGEFVVVRREPGNPYDSNAIRIDNVAGQQIGHIPRRMAEKLAPFMDAKSLLLEGNLTENKAWFEVPIALKLFGTNEPVQAAALKLQMQAAKLPVTELVKAERERKQRQKEAEKQAKEDRKRMLKNVANRAGGVRSGSGTQFDNSGDFANLTVPGDDSAELSMDDIINSSTSFNPREIGALVDKYGAGEDVLSQLPMAKQPNALATQLLPYQRQGLMWMIDRENPILPPPGSDDSVQLWKRRSDGMFTNLATNFTEKEPSLASGGILADDMGLGKTIQVISLLMADPHRSCQPTLIVSPLSVMSNWSSQIQAHMKPEHELRVFIYHGSNKKHERLEDYDVVITTYQTLSQEYLPAGCKTPSPLPSSSGLYSVDWRRVVLDEGHQIRNPKAKMSNAAYAVPAKSRWLLTGTPIVNNLRDLFSHVKFLRLSGGLEQQDVFSGALIRPLNAGDPEASVLLQALVSTICLRRMKDMKFIDLRLPELTSHKYSVAFAPRERKKYDAFQSEAQGLLNKYKTCRNAKGKNTYSNLLEVLLRLRQTCNHWMLCGERLTNLMVLLEKNKKVELNLENLKALRQLLQVSIDSQEDCPVCLDNLHNPVITSCAHVFGGDCIERVIETQHKCPMCRAELEDNSCLVQPAAALGEADDELFDVDAGSSKLDALLNILKASQKKKGTKTVVFSQWTSFLDIIQSALERQGFRYCRLDGKMNATRRDEAMEQLAQGPDCKIMLASLSVCSVGLNLVAANQVILTDSWWAPAIEDQAVDRVHRLGQTKPTTVFRLVMEDSIEERVLEIQQEKRKLMMVAFQEKTMKRGKEKSARLADIERLLR